MLFIVLVIFFLWYQMLQIRVVLYTLLLIFDYPHHIRFYLGIVPVYLLLHDVVAVRIPELVDDGYFLVGFGFRRHLLIIDNNSGMEYFLVNLFPEVIRHTAHKRTLRQVGDFRCRNEGIHLRVDGGGSVLPVDGDGLPLLEYLAEAFRKVLRRFSHDLTAEDITHRILDNLRLFFTIVTGQLREVLEAETDRHLIASGGGDQVVDAAKIYSR